MKKWIQILVMAVMLLAFVGCNRQTRDDIYGTTDKNVDAERTTIAESVTEAPTTGEDDTTSAEDETTASVETGSETVQDDMYDAGAETATLDDGEIETVQAVGSVKDPKFTTNMATYLDPVYYNILFGDRSYPEGFTEYDMIRFAASYVLQYEYNDGKFEVVDNEFILYVPEERVTSLVKRYFDIDILEHQGFEDPDIVYEDGYYLMKAVGKKWGDEATIEVMDAVAINDFTFDVTFRPAGAESLDNTRVKAVVELLEGRYVLRGYEQLPDAEPDSEASAGEATTTAE